MNTLLTKLKLFPIVAAFILVASMITPSAPAVAESPAADSTVSITLAQNTFTFTEGEDSPWQSLNFTINSAVTPESVFLTQRNDVGTWGCWKSLEGNAGAPFGVTFGSRLDNNGGRFYTYQGNPQVGTAGTYTNYLTISITVNGVRNDIDFETNVIVLPTSKPKTKPTKLAASFKSTTEQYDINFAFSGLKVNAPYSYMMDNELITGSDIIMPYQGKATFNGDLGMGYKLPKDIRNGWHEIQMKSTYYDDSPLNYSVWFFVKHGSITVFDKSPTLNAVKYSSCKKLNKKYPYGVAKNSIVIDSAKTVLALGYKAYVNKSLYKKNAKLDTDHNGIVCER
jgi:hypothetical protein